MNSTNVFEQVRKGAITPRQGADQLAKNREQEQRPSKPAWLPKPLYILGVVLLAFLVPKLFGRGA